MTHIVRRIEGIEREKMLMIMAKEKMRNEGLRGKGGRDIYIIQTKSKWQIF